jgi:hypothetical protein
LRSPGKQQYYDPIIEGEEDAQVQLRAIAAPEPGTYILFEDMLDAIRSFALSVDTFKKQQGIHELLQWLEATGDAFYEGVEEEGQEAVPVKRFKTRADAERIELYPDGDRKWHARLVDHDGNDIGEANGGSFDRDWVEKDASAQYPDLIIHQMEGEDEDSNWTGKGPSPRLWGKN